MSVILKEREKNKTDVVQMVFHLIYLANKMQLKHRL